MTNEYYPPTGFHFEVTLVGSLSTHFSMTDIDASFQEVSGIEAHFDVEEVAEGGENRFVHRLPKPAKYSNLVLKRGIVTKDSYLAEWVGQTIGSSLAVPIVPQNLAVILMDEESTPTVAWGFVNAFPLKWQVASLNSTENKILTETLEFSYNFFSRTNLNGRNAATKLAEFISSLS